MRRPLSRRRIYLDYASATPVRREAAAAQRAAGRLSGNPGSIHAEGLEAARSLSRSRGSIARELACKPREVVFTSGLTESNNLGILGFAELLARRQDGLSGTHWITSAIEHQSVLACFAEIERRGASVTYAAPEQSGVVAVENVSSALRPESVFVSIGWANGEIGVVQPLRAIASAIAAHEKRTGKRVLLHADAGQAPLYRAPNVHALGVDLFGIGSGKLYGPRGVGALYVGRRAELAPLAAGGGQERGLRAGTEAPALAAGFAAALAAGSRERRAEAERIGKLRDALAAGILGAVPGAVVNGDLRHALPHMLNVSIPGVNGEYVVLALDRAGIAVSTKAACSEGAEDASHVVAAIAGDGQAWRARSSLRFSLGKDTAPRSVASCVRQLARVAKTMPVSPV